MITALLQDRLSEEEMSVAQQAAQSLSYNERLCVRLRTLEARKKAVEAEIEGVKEEARALVENGEMVGSMEVGGYYTLRPSKDRESYDLEGMMMDGLLTRAQAEPYKKVTPVKPAFVFKPDKGEK